MNLIRSLYKDKTINFNLGVYVLITTSDVL